jgi:hypothetical protein
VQVIADLEVLVKRAIKNSDKRTPFERAQHKVARLYNKAWYQNAVTSLLVVVRIQSLSSPFSLTCCSFRASI